MPMCSQIPSTSELCFWPREELSQISEISRPTTKSLNKRSNCEFNSSSYSKSFFKVLPLNCRYLSEQALVEKEAGKDLLKIDANEFNDDFMENVVGNGIHVFKYGYDI